MQQLSDLFFTDGVGDGNDLRIADSAGNFIVVDNITWADIMDDIDIVTTV